MTVIAVPPNAACASRPPTRTMVRSAANSRDASLYGLSTGVTDSTPGSERSGTSSSSDSSPMQPMIVRCSPRERCVRMPTDSMRSRMWSISASVTLGRVMMIMSRVSKRRGRKRKTTRGVHGSLGWCAVLLSDSTAYASNHGP